MKKRVHWKHPADVDMWVANSKPGDIVVYAESVQHLGPETPAPVRRALQDASTDGLVFLQQRRLPAIKGVFYPRYNYEAVRISPKTARSLDNIGGHFG